MIKFRGWGFNIPTILAAILIAILLSGLLTVANPVVMPSGAKPQAAAAVYPCDPGPWNTRWVTNKHGAWPFWEITIRAKIKWNGCDIKVVPYTQRCSWWAIGYGIDQKTCDNYRIYKYTAYGQNLVLRGYFYLSVIANGFPLGTTVHMCQWYERFGRLINTQNGPYGSGC